ncbi:hypothetical protein NL676_017482 [Syzygium grande]|nr:hypothetical protein NL676_017482 [Syzygium grande]
MEKIKHSHVAVSDVNLHVAEIGEGPKVVVFLHGFPEIWYTWRHQMIGVANAGYRTIAIDCRGYGLSDQPLDPEKGCYADLVEDVVTLLDALGIAKAFLVGKDFGAMPAYLVAVVKPERVCGVITLGIPLFSTWTPVHPTPSLFQRLLHSQVAGTWASGSRLQRSWTWLTHRPRYLHDSPRKILRPMHPCMRSSGFGSPCRFHKGLWGRNMPHWI